MTNNLPAEKSESALAMPQPERKADLSRRELLQKAGWVIPAIVVSSLARDVRFAQRLSQQQPG